MPETLKAAQVLVKEVFDVMLYCADDPIQANMLEDIGCVAVMPLASLIGSGMGSAMKKAVEAGREAFLAGRMQRKYYSADPSSPTTGLIGS